MTKEQRQTLRRAFCTGFMSCWLGRPVQEDDQIPEVLADVVEAAVDRYLDEHAESLTQYIIVADMDEVGNTMYKVGWGAADGVMSIRENRAGVDLDQPGG